MKRFKIMTLLFVTLSTLVFTSVPASAITINHSVDPLRQYASLSSSLSANLEKGNVKTSGTIGSEMINVPKATDVTLSQISFKEMIQVLNTQPSQPISLLGNPNIANVVVPAPVQAQSQAPAPTEASPQENQAQSTAPVQAQATVQQIQVTTQSQVQTSDTKVVLATSQTGAPSGSGSSGSGAPTTTTTTTTGLTGPGSGTMLGKTGSAGAAGPATSTTSLFESSLGSFPSFSTGGTFTGSSFLAQLTGAGASASGGGSALAPSTLAQFTAVTGSTRELTGLTGAASGTMLGGFEAVSPYSGGVLLYGAGGPLAGSSFLTQFTGAGASGSGGGSALDPSTLAQFTAANYARNTLAISQVNPQQIGLTPAMIQAMYPEKQETRPATATKDVVPVLPTAQQLQSLYGAKAPYAGATTIASPVSGTTPVSSVVASGLVQRTVAIPSEADPTKITTGVVLAQDKGVALLKRLVQAGVSEAPAAEATGAALYKSFVAAKERQSLDITPIVDKNATISFIAPKTEVVGNPAIDPALTKASFSEVTTPDEIAAFNQEINKIAAAVQFNGLTGSASVAQGQVNLGGAPKTVDSRFHVTPVAGAQVSGENAALYAVGTLNQAIQSDVTKTTSETSVLSLASQQESSQNILSLFR